MSTTLLRTPALDCHAHMAPDVTGAQVQALGGAYIFAVTRSLEEAHRVAGRRDDTITWGLGVHPGLASARSTYTPVEFLRLLPRFALVGEVGLDRRAGNLPGQRIILESILKSCSDQPVLVSVHSTGATGQVTDVVERLPHPGLILHWFLGSPDQIRAVTASGAYFSVNAAMSDEALAALPADRVLPETDFPARRTRAHRPGDVAGLDRRLADLWQATTDQVRHRSWRNLRRLATQAAALDRLPESLGDLLLDF